MTDFSPRNSWRGPWLQLFLAGLLALLVAFTATAQQNMGIGTRTPHSSAALDITSTDKGLLPPRLTLDERNAIQSPAAGLTIYNTTTNKLNTWNGTSWTEALITAEQATVLGPAVTFAFTGAPQTYTVPPRVVSLEVVADGGSGGNYQSAGGGGARVTATITVTPGQVLTVYVGGKGGDVSSPYGGYNGGGGGSGGGGGGASDVRTGGASLADRLVVAGGGGGSTGFIFVSSDGAPGGAPDGGSVYNPFTASTHTGGTQAGPGSPGNAGLGNGSVAGLYGGGGGGGYYGGGAGSYMGGAGGSSWVTPTGSSAITMTAGANIGNGVVILKPKILYAAPVLDGANFVNVPGTYDNLGNHIATQNLNLATNQLVGNGGSTGIAISAAGNVGVNTTTPGATLDVNGSTRLGGLAGSGTRMVTADADGNLTATTTGDNLGNHNATQNLNLGTSQLVGNGGSSGVAISNTGSVGIGTTTPAASAVLDVASTTKGFLPPRLTAPQRDAMASPAAGLTIYNTTSNRINTWNGTAWMENQTEVTQLPTQTFVFTGAPQTYTVPDRVTYLDIDARGAQGRGYLYPASVVGGSGARVLTRLTVTPGQVLHLFVGGQATGWNGGGDSPYQGGCGGGATDIRIGGTALSDRVVVAAGGGGAGYAGSGGAGGAPNGASGAAYGSYSPGTGATQSAGGNAGGVLGQGGTTNPFNGNTAGGGGGGYYGGGTSPGSAPFGAQGGGGGGSSWVSPTGTSNVAMTAGANSGNGVLIITPGPAYPAPMLYGTNIVEVPSASLTGALPALNGNALTNLNAANLTGGPLPALNGNALTNLNAASLTGGPLPTLNGNALTNLNAASLTGGPLPALNGNALTNINAAALTGGPLPTLNGNALTNLNAASLTGGPLPALNGAALTSLSAGQLTGALPALNGNALTSLNASNLTGGPLPALNGNALTNLNAANLTGGPLPALNGAALTSLNASNLSSGTVAVARLGLTPQNGGLVFSSATALQQNSAQLFWDNSNNRLGVGTNAPIQPLHVQRSTSGVAAMALLRNTAGGTGTGAALDLQTYDPGANAGNARIQAVDDGAFGADLVFLTKQTGAVANALVDRLHIWANGNVGINTNNDLLLRDTNHGLGWYGSGKQWNGFSPDGPALYGYSGGILGTNQAGTRAIALYWGSNGRVGIGTTSPEAGLTVSTPEKTAIPTGEGIFLSGGPGTGNPNIELRGTGDTPYIDFAINTTSDFTSRIIEGNGLQFRVNGNTGADPDLYVRSSDGNVGIGTNNPHQALTVIGNICSSGGINCASDARYKKDVTVLHDALANVLRLRGVTYFWKQAEFPDKHFGPERQLGFIAQEVEQLYPEMVATDPAGYKSVDYSRLTPVLVEAIKELKAENDRLRAAQSTDHADLQTLKEQMARLLGEAPTGTQVRK